MFGDNNKAPVLANQAVTGALNFKEVIFIAKYSKVNYPVI